jgi:lipoate-protein ligase A
MVKTWRLLDSGAAPGSYNLALDEAVFRLAREGKSPSTVRFYAWSTPAVSVGYFQRWERQIDPEACRRQGIGVYRRITGGRAVLHRDEITYSVACADAGEQFGEGLQASYRTIASALAEGLRLLGVEAELAEPSSGRDVRRAARNPSCFAASSGHEIGAGGRKLAGSAQKREGDDFLQHGSILVSRHDEEFRSLLRSSAHPSAADFGMTSLEELLGCRPCYPELAAALAEGFRKILGVPLEEGAPTGEERKLTKELEERRYLSPAWNGGGETLERSGETADFLL